MTDVAWDERAVPVSLVSALLNKEIQDEFAEIVKEMWK
jgi:hypothetical protein